jgi:hypothetical protein
MVTVVLSSVARTLVIKFRISLLTEIGADAAWKLLPVEGIPWR